MQLKTFEDLIAEIRDLISSQVPLARARTLGTLKFYELKTQLESLSDNSGIHWILRAQIGTLDKLDTLLPGDRDPSSLEILAWTRNVFENLVWLKLFVIDSSWGLFFYGQFLKNHLEDLEGIIAKLNAEAELFDSFDAEDTAIFDDVFGGIDKIDEPTSEDIAGRSKEHHRLKAELDIRVRRTFALSAAAATINGYAYQAHLLRTKQIPHLQKQLDAIKRRTEDFKQEVGDQTKISRYLGKWNWRGEAQRVGMLEQYDFLYRLTSRLLHATPMNIVTEKELTRGERLTLLEYVVVSIQDTLETIDCYEFPGKLDALFVDTGEAPTPSTG